MDLLAGIDFVAVAEHRDDVLGADAGDDLRLRSRRLDHDHLGLDAVIGEFEMLRAARVMLLLAGAGVAADRVLVAGQTGPAPAAAKKGRPAALPDRMDIDLEPV